MTGAEHYREAEDMLAFIERDRDLTTNQHSEIAARAQVHATLALAAATALAGVIGNNLAPSHPVNQLAQDPETITAVNDWHEAAARRAS
ncbi:hypothetical protein NWF34_09925 [Gordonia sp. GONU]|uniref:hypothetical protein n=1 Tax=Gordonia sp. GONU TaxID=2972949 RepID=UPI0021AC7261|nr:hypothetical protein [Gordonia sp. GONU]MCR8897265.1 hypothetical protein [Gordonia sp. GONU]UTN93566.1 hypothetical protein SEA_OREGANO_53 [Gordonia phage Oregano]